MNIRCGKYSKLQTYKKSKSYKNIIIDFNRSEYKNYCIINKDYILSLKRPSVDRIDKLKNYTLNNIQIIELSDNIRKDKLTFTNLTGICRKCKEEKELENFSKDKRKINGLTNICKICDNKRKTTGK